MTQRSVTPERLEDKDRIIRKLKNEIIPLKQKEQSLPMLDHTLRNLVERYKLIQQDKFANETEYKLRHEGAARAIADLKAQHQALTGQFRDLNLEINDYRADSNTLRTQVDKSNNEIDKLKKEGANLFADNEGLNIQRVKLLQLTESVEEENARLAARINSINSQNAEVSGKIGEIKTLIGEMSTDKKILYDKIVGLQNANNQLDGKIESTVGTEDSTMLEVRKKEDQIRAEVERLADLEARAKKLKSDLVFRTNNLRTETERGVELSAMNRGAEKKLKDLQTMISNEEASARQQAKQNQDLVTTNSKLSKDLELCDGHLENLLAQTDLLNKQLDRFAEEDEYIKRVVSARRRVSRPTIDYALKASRTTLGYD